MKDLNYQKVVLAGVAGTLAFTVLLFIGPMMGLPKMDMGQMLGPMNPMVAMPYWMGWVMHFIIGIVLTGIYAAFFVKLLPSDGWKRGAIWGLIPFLLAQIMVMPMMGMGVFSGGNVLMIMGSLMTHLAYGSVAGLVYGDG
ncbi:MAG: hypothetical protein IIA61_01700 [Candidatus Marinimicrobia bacterium]|nr:hypothetical protein [Candidatus Neomarinimicrobiota bacterium]